MTDMTDAPRCELCGRKLRKPPPRTWTPDPALHATVREAAQELNLSKQRTRFLIAERWLDVAGYYYSSRSKKSINSGVLYVIRESIATATQRQSHIFTNQEKRDILQTLSDIGIIGQLDWYKNKNRYPRYDR